MATRVEIKGMKELERTFKRMGRVPQSIATPAARAGARIGYRAAKKNAPVDTGELRDGIIMKKERRTVPGKAVYDTMMDPAKTDLYRRATKSGTRRVGGKGFMANRRRQGDYYYPASQEYGFMTVNGRYIPGYRFLRRSITEHDREIRQAMIDTAWKRIEKVWNKG